MRYHCYTYANVRNTKKRATIRFMLYPSGKGKYTAVCLDLGIVRQGSDPLRLQKRMVVLAERYIKNIVKHKLDDALLNQTLPTKYVKKYEQIAKALVWQKWQKAFEALIWQWKQEKGKLLATG